MLPLELGSLGSLYQALAEVTDLCAALDIFLFKLNATHTHIKYVLHYPYLLFSAKHPLAYRYARHAW